MQGNPNITIEIDNQGRGREIDNSTGKVIFEGFYQQGIRNGPGKEYDTNGHLIFEGEFLNGQRRKGKEYDTNGHIIFEGEYINGQRAGITREYITNGNLLFEGVYINGQMTGHAGENNTNGNLLFEGEYIPGHGTQG